MGVSTPNKLNCSECGAEIQGNPGYRFVQQGYCIRWLAVCQECRVSTVNDIKEG